MISSIKFVTLLSLIALSEAQLRPVRTLENGHWRRARNGGGNGGNTGNNGQTSTGSTGNTGNNALALNPAVLQTASSLTGLEPGLNGSTTADIVASATSNDNFINYCANSKLPLMNGTQIRTGACNGIPMGEIFNFDSAPATKWQFPTNGAVIQSNTAFTAVMNIKNFNVGQFTNAQATYYSAPCSVTNGIANGHTHMVIESVALDSTTPLNANTFAFFLGLKSAGSNGQVTGTVTAGLKAGNYRLSTINTCSNHQALNGPIAQRGSLDDQVYFVVSDNASSGSGGNTGGNQGNAQTTTTTVAATSTGNKGNNGGNQGGNKGATTTTSTKAAATTTASNGNNGASSTGNLQKFTAAQSIGSIAPPPVTNSGDRTRPFSVQGNTFVNLSAAVQRSCSVQNNLCANAVNSGKIKGSSVSACNAQEQKCNAANGF